jgi:ATP-dependent Lon protease
MAIDLLNLKPQQISKNLRGKYIMLYGLPGVGKTSLAA